MSHICHDKIQSRLIDGLVQRIKIDSAISAFVTRIVTQLADVL